MGGKRSESEKDVATSPEVRMVCFEDGRSGCEPRVAAEKLEKSKEVVLPLQSPEGASLADTLILAQLD